MKKINEKNSSRNCISIQLQSCKPPIFIDGRNVAYSKKGQPSWSLVQEAASYFNKRGFRVTIVMPHWAGKDLLKEIRRVAKLQLVDIGQDKEYDDKLVLGLCLVEDGYFVSNDKRISKHIRGGIGNRAWCNSRRISFDFDENNQFVPNYPDRWVSVLSEITQIEGFAIETEQEVRA